MSQSSLMPLPALKETLAVLQADYPHVDPPRLHGIAQLLARAEQQRPAVQAPLLRRASALLNDYRQACENSGEGESRLATIVSTRRQQLAQRRSGAASALRALQRQLNSETVTPSESAESRSPISALLRQQELSLLGGVADSNTEPRSSEPPRELRALRLLRSRHGWKKDLRAHGDILRDQAFFLWRCGIDVLELREDKDPNDALEAFREFSVTYQPAEDTDKAIYHLR